MITNIENMLFFSNSSDCDLKDCTLESLATKAGFIRQSSSGFWSLSTLGVAALRNVENKVRETMEGLGACEFSAALLQDEDLWRESGRLESYGEEMMRTRTRGGRTLFLGGTAEEAACKMVAETFGGKAFEGWMFQIGTKWRDELRARHGLVRAREFRMMDAYSFSRALEDERARMEDALTRTERMLTEMGLSSTRKSADCGEIGGLESVELTVKSHMGDADGELEVGHMFLLGDRYTSRFGLKADGKALNMGCQGVGTSRLTMALLESHRDDRGFKGTKGFSAADVHVLSLGGGSEEKERAHETAVRLSHEGYRVILDNRDISAGKKFYDSDLMCVRERVVISKRNRGKAVVEMENRESKERREVILSEALSLLG